MKNRSPQRPLAKTKELSSYPDSEQLAALRAWYAGMSSRKAVERYIGETRQKGQSSRKAIRNIRQQLIAFASSHHQYDVAQLLAHPDRERAALSHRVLGQIEHLRHAILEEPLVTDGIERWLPVRTCIALRGYGIRTLSDLTVRIPRRKMWWANIDGLGVVGAKQIEVFFANHPQLTERARTLIAVAKTSVIAPWEVLEVPSNMSGAHGAFRAPCNTCSLCANNDYEAIHAWLSVHESPPTLRAYRKEAERLILWAVFERGLAMSSLTAEDAVAYRAFLRRPPQRWVGPSRSRQSSEWRPFVGPLSPKSVAYALSVLCALYRWLIEQGYVLINPFSGIKVRGAACANAIETHHVFSESEWALIRTIADGLEWSYGYKEVAAQRLRFILDFAYATGLRISELVGVTLRCIHLDDHDDHWLQLVGKGGKLGQVALPPLARSALRTYLAQRGLSTSPNTWLPATKLIGAIDLENQGGISATRLWVVMKQFFETAAKAIQPENPALADKLRLATPHWMRHTHATHALARGAELTAVRDNLRHTSIATTSIYLHGDKLKRAKQMGHAFLARE